MICRLYTKHMPDTTKRRLPKLFKDVSDSCLFAGGNSVVMVFYDDDKHLMGAANYTIGTPTKYNRDSKPKFNIYIDRFEVVPRSRRKGYGARMFAHIQKTYADLAERFSLIHCSNDRNASYRFWQSNGFRHRGGNSYMEKVMEYGNGLKPARKRDDRPAPEPPHPTYRPIHALVDLYSMELGD